MDETNVPVVQDLAAKEGELYAMFLDMAITGKNAHVAIKTTTLKLTTFYYWKKHNPVWFASVRDRALEDAIQMRREHPAPVSGHA